MPAGCTSSCSRTSTGSTCRSPPAAIAWTTMVAVPVAARRVRHRVRPMRALVQRVSRASVDASTASGSPRSARGCSCCSASRHDDDRGDADRLADKVRALRIFPDAEGRMNEPLGDEREVLCVSPVHALRRRAQGQPPVLRRRRPARARRAAVRALLRPPGRPRRRVRRPHGRRARQRRPGDAAARSAVGCGADAARGPLRLPLRRRAAAGPAALRPLGRHAAGRVPGRRACGSTPRATSSASPAR